MAHSETAFIPMNVGRKGGKPWFAIACLGWTATQARNAMVAKDSQDKKLAWELCRKDGWRIVKVRVTST